jgi:hypothetical protein
MTGTLYLMSLSSVKSAPSSGHEYHHQSLLQLISIQNETIALMEQQIMKLITNGADKINHIPDSLQNMIHQHQQSLSPLNTLIEKPAPVETKSSIVSVTEDTHYYDIDETDTEKECEQRYGLSLAENWAKNRQIWCEDPNKSSKEDASELICYPYHQVHKKKDGRGPDLFCIAKNFVIDFSKIHGQHSNSKPSLGQQYLSFSDGSLTASCRKTSQFNGRLFMPHQQLQVKIDFDIVIIIIIIIILVVCNISR